ncbi:hypothetical protein FHL15_010212 [Xylaria flabelliformis]|uniref:Uncharacterized protein n=1 Tax=Xylaria flabelliformis TaxID=2512241 RepID=A0A553HLP1_9PEZI|nr:hypothetical protein FHL15_010212 [Xylaria flabelliformis]
MMGAPSDVFALFDPRPWIRVPGLTLLGIAIWCIPLTAVVTPGTLTVITHSDSRIENLSVPQLSYDSSTWTDATPGSNQAEFYGGASKAVEWASLESAITGEILKISSYQHLNQSYRIAFNGPAIRCSNANDAVRRAAKERVEILSAKNITDLSYLSWAGADDHGFLTPIKDSYTVGLSGYPAGFKVSNNVSECLLYDTLYDVNFEFTNGVSSLTIKNLTYNEKIPSVMQISHPLGLVNIGRDPEGIRDVISKHDAEHVLREDVAVCPTHLRNTPPKSTTDTTLLKLKLDTVATDSRAVGYPEIPSLVSISSEN